ncbi:MAG: hypothetical protein KDD62_08310, partial [Bdellovibrionales bacterium]|nr:hypothetical protein [Bdellovibrionales bacterium]
MLRHFRNLLGMLSMLVAFGGSVHAEVGVDLNAAFYSDYMFRGFNLYDGASIQPSVGVSYDMQDAGAVRAGLWSHLSAEGGNGASDKFTELDYILSYDISAGLASFSAGHIWYTFPRDSDGLDDTGEFYGAVSFDTLLSPTVSVYYDYDLFDAFYYE